VGSGQSKELLLIYHRERDGELAVARLRAGGRMLAAARITRPSLGVNAVGHVRAASDPRRGLLDAPREWPPTVHNGDRNGDHKKSGWSPLVISRS
jgi:hypothetical protein